MINTIDYTMNKIFKQTSLNAIVFKLQLIYSTEKLKVAIVQLCNELQVCNFTMLKLTQK